MRMFAPIPVTVRDAFGDDELALNAEAVLTILAP